MNIILTKQQFYDVFLMCLCWQSDLNLPMSCCTTVDKVARILNGLSLLNDTQRKNLHKDKTLQSLFWKNLDMNMNRTLEAMIAESKKEIFIRVSGERVVDVDRFNLAKLLRNEKIYLTMHGKKIVEIDLEKRYSEVITAIQYLEEVRRQEKVFQELDEDARLAILKNYEKRVKDETP